MSIYLACPVKYRFTYLDPKGKWLMRARSSYSFGTSLHKVLQRFHDQQDKGVTTVHEAVSALEEDWIDAGYESPEQMKQAMAEGKSLVESHVRQHFETPRTAATLFVERQLRMDMGKFDLIGRIDRLDEHEDGTMEIVDYKSQRRSVDEEEVATDLAMGCYQILVRQLYPDRPVRATITALQTGDSASASFTDEEADQFRQDVKLLGDEIFDREFDEIEPIPKAICPSCDFVSLCQRYPDFELES